MSTRRRDGRWLIALQANLFVVIAALSLALLGLFIYRSWPVLLAAAVFGVMGFTVAIAFVWNTLSSREARFLPVGGLEVAIALPVIVLSLSALFTLPGQEVNLSLINWEISNKVPVPGR